MGGMLDIRSSRRKEPGTQTGIRSAFQAGTVRHMSEPPSPSLSAYARFSLALAGVLLLPALWSFFSAIVSAVSTGQVLVISVGRTETARELVPWIYGWPRFAAPVIIAASLLLWLSSHRLHRSAWWLSAATSTVGLVLLLFSKWFTSWHGTIWFLGIAVFVAVTLYVGNRFGRLAALAIILLVFGALVWRITGAARSFYFQYQLAHADLRLSNSGLPGTRAFHARPSAKPARAIHRHLVHRPQDAQRKKRKSRVRHGGFHIDADRQQNCGRPFHGNAPVRTHERGRRRDSQRYRGGRHRSTGGNKRTQRPDRARLGAGAWRFIALASERGDQGG